MKGVGPIEYVRHGTLKDAICMKIFGLSCQMVKTITLLETAHLFVSDHFDNSPMGLRPFRDLSLGLPAIFSFVIFQ